jgi:tetratricopeptide (TPR) repeat protein
MKNKVSALLGLFVLFLFCSDAPAGGGPETTLVVVNAESPLSKRIANEYVHMRNIPPSHIIWLEDVPSTRSIPIETFREKIWRPIREYLKVNRLEEEIDIIAYSADFPYSVNFQSDIRTNKIQKHKHMGAKASLTSLTYFGRRVEIGDTGYLGRNHYFADIAGPKIKKGLDSTPVNGVPLNDKEHNKLWRAGKEALGRRDYNAALKYFRKLQASNPRRPRAWYDLSRTLAAAGNRKEALAALEAAVDRGWAHSMLAERDKYLRPLHRDPEFQRLVKRMEASYGPFQLPHGFRNHYVWSSSDLNHWEPKDDLDRYYLSTMLAYTGEQGNSLPEVLGYLAAAAGSDGTRPDGTVYLLENRNIRSQTRQPLFKATVKELAKRGRAAEILSEDERQQDGILPIGKKDVIGAVIGFPDYQWSASGSRLLPGAIAETLTSYGGDFAKGKQTKLTEFLRYGAAGSSGAVMEPFSFQAKFPVPLLHVYYADGCSLAESFYQSLLAPYQLIIVGDPLTRPFAHFAEVALESPSSTQPWSGIVTVVPAVRRQPPKGIGEVELWVDGQFVAQEPVGKEISWDTRGVADGYHDVRLVAVEDSAVETRSSVRFSVTVANSESRVQIKSVSDAVTYGDEVVVSGTAVGMDSVALYYGHRKLAEGEVQEGSWRLVADTADLGIGPVSIQVRGADAAGVVVRSQPENFTVREPSLLSPLSDLKRPVAGYEASIQPDKGEMFRTVAKDVKSLLKELRIRKVTPDKVRLQGHFKVAQGGFYQLLVAGLNGSRIVVDDQAVLEIPNRKNKLEEAFLPLSLEAGWHKLQIQMDKPRRRSNPKILLAGAEVTRVLSGENLFHDEAGGIKPGQF